MRHSNERPPNAPLVTWQKPGFQEKVKKQREKTRLEKIKKDKELQTQLQTHERNLKAKK